MSGTSFETAIMLTLDNEISSTISPNEKERYFAFNTNIGEYYYFETKDGTLDLFVHLYNANRQEFATDDDSGEGNNPAINFRAISSKTYFKIRGYNDPSGIASFKVSIVIGDEPSGTNVYCVAIPIYGYGRVNQPLEG